MIGQVTLLPLICLWPRQIYSLTSLGKSSTTPMEVITCLSASLTHATSRPPPAPPDLTLREQIGHPSVGSPTWMYLARTLTPRLVMRHNPFYTPPRHVFRRLLQFTQSMEFHGRQRIADKHFVSVIDDTGISASSPVKQIS